MIQEKQEVLDNKDLFNSKYIKVFKSTDDLSFIRRIHSNSLLSWMKKIDYIHTQREQLFRQGIFTPLINMRNQSAFVEYNNFVILFDAADVLEDELIKNKNIKIVMISHAHRDHINKLDYILREKKDIVIMMNKITFEIICEYWNEQHLFEEIKLLEKSVLITQEGKEECVLGYNIVSYPSGHCMGANAFFVYNGDWGGCIGFIGEFTTRSVGGYEHKIPKTAKVISLVMDGKNMNEDIYPMGIAEINYNSVLSKLEYSYKESKTPIFETFSLGELQELFVICAYALSEKNVNYENICIGTERKTVKNIMKERNDFPFNVGFKETKYIKKKHINIFTGSEYGNSMFEMNYNKFKENNSFMWLYSEDRRNRPPNEETYKVYSHASKAEIIEMIFSMDPLYVYLSDTHNFNMSLKLSLKNLGFEVLK